MLGNINSKLIVDAVHIQGEEIEHLKQIITNLSKKCLTDASITRILDKLPFKLVDDKVVFSLDVMIGEQSLMSLIKVVNALHGVEDVKELDERLDTIEAQVTALQNNLSKAFVEQTNGKVIFSNDVCFKHNDGQLISVNDLFKRVIELESLIDIQGKGATVQLNNNSSIVMDSGETVTMSEIVQTSREVTNKCSNILLE